MRWFWWVGLGALGLLLLKEKGSQVAVTQGSKFNLQVRATVPFDVTALAQLATLLIAAGWSTAVPSLGAAGSDLVVPAIRSGGSTTVSLPFPLGGPFTLVAITPG